MPFVSSFETRIQVVISLMAQRLYFILGVLVLLIVSSFSQNPTPDSFDWTLRSRIDLIPSTEAESWDASRTAFIVCDMWDYHHSVNAVRRLTEFAPRLNAVLAEARSRGATIIHAPSDCMPFYDSHLARQRALDAPPAKNAPTNIAHWCHRIPEEEQAVYPIDQSNGGEDDDLQEHAQWSAYLETINRNPGTPWQRQTKMISIDSYRDYICAEGDVTWNVLEANNITHVVLTGVHLNMCVLGRPFGLRQMKRSGKTVALMRDMTDVMYEPNSWPYVSHFSGLDLVVEHIEHHICPTVTSDQVIGGHPFRFRNDDRPTVAMSGLFARDQRVFAQQDLRRQFHLQWLGKSSTASETADSDVLLLNDQSQLPAAVIKAFVDAGKPIIAARVTRAWAPSFGISNSTHVLAIEAPLKCDIDAAQHPMLQGIKRITVNSFTTGELHGSTHPLINHHEHGTIAWTTVRPDSGISIALPSFLGSRSCQQLTLNALAWATGQSVAKSKTNSVNQDWQTHKLAEGLAITSRLDEIIWMRCLVKLSDQLAKDIQSLNVPNDSSLDAFINGTALKDRNSEGQLVIPAGTLTSTALNVLALRLTKVQNIVPVLQALQLDGPWQFRSGDDPDWANFPIPPQFGAATDYIFEFE